MRKKITDNAHNPKITEVVTEVNSTMDATSLLVTYIYISGMIQSLISHEYDILQINIMIFMLLVACSYKL